jgi:hypothetical protein
MQFFFKVVHCTIHMIIIFFFPFFLVIHINKMLRVRKRLVMHIIVIKKIDIYINKFILKRGVQYIQFRIFILPEKVNRGLVNIFIRFNI